MVFPRFDLGSDPTIFIGDMEALEDAYKKDEYMSKPSTDSKIFTTLRGLDPQGNKPGVFVSTGKVW